MDPFTNDYKVVLILFYEDKKNCIAVVMVYSLATNSWRLVDNVLPSVSGISILVMTNLPPEGATVHI